MRVVFYSDATTCGGHEVMALRAADGLSRRGHEVHFAAFRGNSRLLALIDEANDRGAHIRRSDTDIGGLRLHTLQAPLRWGRLRACKSLLQHLRPAPLVLVQGHIESCAAAVLAARLAGMRPISYLPMAHDLTQLGVPHLPRLRDAVDRRYYRAIGRFVTISPAAVDDIRRKAPDAQCVIVENVIEPPAAAPHPRAACRDQLGLPQDATLIGMVGRVSFEQKGHDLMLRALVAAPALCQARLVVAGDGPDLARLHQLAAQLGVGDRLIVLGWTSTGMDAVYGALDLLALPSRYEGVPLAMMEALARRLPVIASDSDGMASWLPAGARFRAEAPDSIAKACAHATGPQAADFEPAYRHAQARMDAGIYAAEWEAALQQLAALERS